MQVTPFRLERYFARYEFTTPWLLCSSDCESLSVKDLLALEPGAAGDLQRLWLGYTESRGDPGLRSEIASLYQGITPDQVLVHTGAEEGIFNFMNVVLKAGDHVIIHSPCYQSLSEIPKAIGCKVTLWRGDPSHGWALDMDELCSLLRRETRLVVVNFPHNPTGWLMPKNQFQDLVNLSRQHGFLLFSDEVYRFLEYDPADRLPALCELDERGASLGVMSKAFGLAGLRIGWLVTRDAQLYSRLAIFKDYTSICNSAPSEFLASIALRNRETILSRNLGLVRRNLVQLNSFFSRHPGFFDWQPPIAGPIAFPACLGMPVEEFCRRAVEQKGVLLLPGSLYEEGGHHFRVGFGRKTVPQALELLEQLLA